MTMDKIFEQAIKAHVKEREELFGYKGIKVLSSRFVETIECHDGTILTKFEVVTAIKAKKYEDNRIKWQLNIYDNPTGEKENTIGVYYDGQFYAW